MLNVVHGGSAHNPNQMLGPCSGTFCWSKPSYWIYRNWVTHHCLLLWKSDLRRQALDSNRPSDHLQTTCAGWCCRPVICLNMLLWLFHLVWWMLKHLCLPLLIVDYRYAEDALAIYQNLVCCLYNFFEKKLILLCSTLNNQKLHF